MTCQEAAAKVLREAGTALHYAEIARRILDQNLWTTSGKTPFKTVEARICTDIRTEGASSLFVRVAPRVFGLRELGAQPMVEKPRRSTKRAPVAATRTSRTYSFTEAAAKVLDQFGGKQPMHYRVITAKALETGWLDTQGKTPEASMYAAIGTEIRREKKRGEQPRFVQHGRGFVGLGRWMGRGLAFEIEQHNKRVKQSLHKQLFEMDPGTFEELIGRLLDALGFDDIQVTKRCGDGGIDVRGTLVVGDVIRTRMAVQVKRWKKANNVQAPVVQQVRGSLGTHEQGLIITTSDFSNGASEEARRADAVPVALMNGEKLVTLLVEKDLGITRVTQELIELAEENDGPVCRSGLPSQSDDFPGRSDDHQVVSQPRLAGQRFRTAEQRVPSSRRRRTTRKGASCDMARLPTERELEVPLLQALLKRGGTASSKSLRGEIVRELADLHGLTEQQRSATGSGSRDLVWMKRIRWVRQTLVVKGEMVRGPRGVWAVTEKGRSRVDADGASSAST